MRDGDTLNDTRWELRTVVLARHAELGSDGLVVEIAAMFRSLLGPVRYREGVGLEAKARGALRGQSLTSELVGDAVYDLCTLYTALF